MARRITPPRGSNLESDSCPDPFHSSEMARGGITRSSTGKLGLTETDGCAVRQKLPSTEPTRDSKMQGGYTGTPRDEFRSHAVAQRTSERTMEKPLQEQTRFGSAPFVGPMTFDRRSSPEQRPFDSGTPEQRTFGSETFVNPMTVARQSPLLEQRTLSSGTYVNQMTFDCRSSPEQTSGSGTFLDQMTFDRRPSSEQMAFGSGTYVDPMTIARQPTLLEQRTFGSETILDQMKFDTRSSPDQKTLSMSPTQEVVEDRDQSDEDSRQSLLTTAMETWTIEEDDVPLPEATPFVDPAIFALQDEDGDTYLHLAIISERIDLVLGLIHLAPDPLWLDRTNQLKQTALHLATVKRQPSVIRRLLSRGAKRVFHDVRGNTPLHIACLNGHLDCVHELTSSCPASVMTSDDFGFNQSNYEGQTCLHLAASKNQFDVIRYLVENCGLNVNQKELRRGCTILHRAVITSNLELLDHLLRLPASAELIIDEPTYDGYTALLLARLTQQTHIEQMLLLAGADPVGFYHWPPPQA